MFDRTAAIRLIREGRCPCQACQGRLSHPSLSEGGWGFAIFTALGESVDWARFWRRFYDHSPKASNISLLDYMYGSKFTEWASGDLEAIKADEAGVDEAARQAAIMAIAKNRALYVDWGKASCSLLTRPSRRNGPSK